MLKLKKKICFKNNNIVLKNIFGFMNIFFIDKKIIIPKNIKINKSIFLNKNIIDIFYKKNIILLSIKDKKNKKNIINLYTSLIKIKLKEIIQNFKINLFLQGIGFKALVENNFLILKLGYSHEIKILIPKNIIILIKNNQIILKSKNWLELTQFVYNIRKYKKPEPYKGKGILLKNEIIFKKEGKKNKK